VKELLPDARPDATERRISAERSCVTEKPWGSELLLRLTERYAVKVLRLKAGCRLSLQYHRFKRETLQLASGRAFLETHHDGRITRHTMEQPVEVPPGTVHRVTALEDCEIVEVSSTELDDVVRLEDDFGRVESGSTRQ
jgi:mannose-6-phosphate isomerase-like protein (cupin superfamily)